MADLINYDSFDKKTEQYHSNYVIDDVQTLDQVLQELGSNPNLIYRGVNNAAFRLYTSAQRHYIWKDELYKFIGGIDYHTFVRNSINIVRNSEDVMDYFNNHSIPVNDFLILAFLQHYKECSPLLDFAYSLESSLFFAQDGYAPAVGDGSLNDYISLYFTSNQIDWLQATIQNITKIGAENVDRMVEETEKDSRYSVDTSDVLYNMQNLTYEDYIDGIHFLPIAGASIGVTEVVMKYVGKSWRYHMTNPRLQNQNGLFIFNVSDHEPLAEQVNNVTKYYKIFGCINIHKDLIPHITQKYLMPNGLTHDAVYCQSKESRDLEIKVSELFIKKEETI